MRKASGVLALAVMGLSVAGSSAPSNQAVGYLAPGEFDVQPVLEPAPRPGDPRYDTDRRIFRATRKVAGTARWQLATNDADFGVPALLHDYSCAVGVQLTPENAPKLVAVVKRAAIDTGGQTYRAKEQFQRRRPFTIDRGPVCQPTSELFDTAHNRMSYDYPSGHTTWGWTWALILTALAPDRAQSILNRGRAYGDSRFICGAHNESAVEAGFQSASATMTLVSTKPAYQQDIAAARMELAGLRAGGAPAAQGCGVEADLVSERVMPKLDQRRSKGR